MVILPIYIELPEGISTYIHIMVVPHWIAYVSSREMLKLSYGGFLK